MPPSGLFFWGEFLAPVKAHERLSSGTLYLFVSWIPLAEGASLPSDQAIPERPSNPAQVERRKRSGKGGRTNGTLTEEALPAIFDLAAPLAWLALQIDSQMEIKRCMVFPATMCLAVTE